MCDSIIDSPVKSTFSTYLAIGLSLTIIMLILLTLIVSMGVFIKVRKTKKESTSTQSQFSSDEAHRVTFKRKETCSEDINGNEYDYTTVVCGNSGQSETDKEKLDSIATESNVAYATSAMIIEENVAYGSSRVPTMTSVNEPMEDFETDYDNIYDN